MARGSASVHCARSIIGALAPVAQDVVIAGLDADFVTVLVIPDVNACAAMLASCGHSHVRGACG